MRSIMTFGRRELAGGIALALVLVSGMALAARGGAGQEPDEEAAERRQRAEVILRDNCLYCHGREMIDGQRLTPAQWQASVEKMVNWGAPLSAEERPLLAAYLAETYPPGRPAEPPKRITNAEALATIVPQPETPRGDAARGEPLYVEHCASCHGPRGEGADQGPALANKPVLTRPADWDAVTLQGRGKMPGFQLVLEAQQSADIRAWLKGEPSR